MAGLNPLVTLAGEPRCPFAAKTALVIAIAKTAPSQPAHWAAGERPVSGQVGVST